MVASLEATRRMVPVQIQAKDIKGKNYENRGTIQRAGCLWVILHILYMF